MPVFTTGRRWQPTYSSFKRESFGQRILASVQKVVKGPIRGRAIQNAVEPVMQIAARDRTRVDLQAELVSANALGVRNILCLSGDSMKLAPGPHGRMDIVDLD